MRKPVCVPAAGLMGETMLQFSKGLTAPELGEQRRGVSQSPGRMSRFPDGMPAHAPHKPLWAEAFPAGIRCASAAGQSHLLHGAGRAFESRRVGRMNATR
jgi:hypothetical protein